MLCVQADLLDQAVQGQSRQATAFRQIAQSVQQLQRAALVALRGRDPGQGQVGKQDGVGKTRAFDHVQPVGQQGRCGQRLVAFPQAGRKHGRVQAGDLTAAARRPFGLGDCRPKHGLGLEHVAVPEMAQAEQHRPEREREARGAPVRRPFRQREDATHGIGLPGVQAQVRHGVAISERPHRFGDVGGKLRPTQEQIGYQAELVGVTGGARRHQGGDELRLVVDRRIVQHVPGDAESLGIAFAQRHRPGGDQAQVHVRRDHRVRNAFQPGLRFSDLALAAQDPQRLRGISLRQRLVARRQRVRSRFGELFAVGEPATGPPVQLALLRDAKLLEAAQQEIAHQRMQPIPILVFGDDQDRRVEQKLVEERGGLGFGRNRLAHRRAHAVEDGDPGQERRHAIGLAREQ